MSHSLSSVTLKDVEKIVTAEPLKVPAALKMFLVLLIVGGIGAAYLGLSAEDSKNTWATIHINFIYFFLLSAAATGFSAVFHICNAQWARPIRRLFESSSNFLLWSIPFLLVVIYLGHTHLFSWSHEHVSGKGIWLTTEFVFIRQIVLLFLLAWIARRVVYYSVRRDIGAIRSGLTGLSDEKTSRWKDKAFDSYVAGWNADSQAELEECHTKLSRLSPLVVIFYALVISFLAWDFVMSIDPHWYSTLFGAFIFMGGVYMAMAWNGMGVGIVRELHPLFKAKIEKRTLWDLGKLLLGFGIFWAYLFWSHYLTIWYGNLPEETAWVILRLREEPWHSFAWMILASCFIIPFFLGLSREVKQVPFLLFLTGGIVATGMWLQDYLLIVPSLYRDTIPLNIKDLFISLGFMGAYLLSCIAFLEKVPLIPFGDLYRKS